MKFKKENYKAMLENRNILISDLEKKIYNLTQENLAVHDENKDLRFENDEQTELIKKVTNLVNSNKYNNEKAVLSKIKELISDFDSQN